jgi:hypothetical protein
MFNLRPSFFEMRSAMGFIVARIMASPPSEVLVLAFYRQKFRSVSGRCNDQVKHYLHEVEADC